MSKRNMAKYGWAIFFALIGVGFLTVGKLMVGAGFLVLAGAYLVFFDIRSPRRSQE